MVLEGTLKKMVNTNPDTNLVLYNGDMKDTRVH